MATGAQVSEQKEVNKLSERIKTPEAAQAIVADINHRLPSRPPTDWRHIVRECIMGREDHL